jgi:hypothetical protein
MTRARNEVKRVLRCLRRFRTGDLERDGVTARRDFIAGCGHRVRRGESVVIVFSSLPGIPTHPVNCRSCGMRLIEKIQAQGEELP